MLPKPQTVENAIKARADHLILLFCVVSDIRILSYLSFCREVDATAAGVTLNFFKIFRIFSVNFKNGDK